MKHPTFTAIIPAAVLERRQRHQQIFRLALWLLLPLALAGLWFTLRDRWALAGLVLPLLGLLGLGLRQQRLSAVRAEQALMVLLGGLGLALNLLRLLNPRFDLLGEASLPLVIVVVLLFQKPRWVLYSAAPYALLHLSVSVLLISRHPSPERWLSLLTTATTLALVGLLYFYRQWWEQAHDAERTYQRLAYTDDLTTLPNRRALQAVWRGYPAASSTGAQIAVMMADIDHFKRVNDHYGHPEGDRLLWLVGQLIQRQLRPLPKQPPHPTVGRWGGEEFLILVPNTTPTLAYLLAEAIRESVETADAAVPLTISLGIALREGEESLADTAARADVALYRAKQAGRNRVVLYRGDKLAETSFDLAELLADEAPLA